VAEYLRVSWDLVKKIHKTRLAVKYRTINLSEVRYLGIDEFSLKKRHTYMTIFVDIQSGRILHAVEGTSKEAIALSPDRSEKGQKTQGGGHGYEHQLYQRG